MLGTIEAERQAIIVLRDEGQIGNDAMHLLQRELDLEAARHIGHGSEASSRVSVRGLQTPSKAVFLARIKQSTRASTNSRHQSTPG
jgi:hypothetical protein